MRVERERREENIKVCRDYLASMCDSIEVCTTYINTCMCVRLYCVLIERGE